MTSDIDTGTDGELVQLANMIGLVSWAAEVLADPSERLMLIDDQAERIDLETNAATPGLSLFQLVAMDEPGHVVLASKHEVGAEAPASLAAWRARTDLLYLAAYDDRTEDATGRGFVDLVTSRGDYAEGFRELFGGGSIRTREEMAAHERLGEALAAWEAGDDSIAVRLREPRLAHLREHGGANALARLRWGTGHVSQISDEQREELDRRLERSQDAFAGRTGP